MGKVLSHDTAILFDMRGRRLAPLLTAPRHERVRGRFVCDQPAIDYAVIHGRISQHLGCGGLSVSAFQQRAEAILQTMRCDPRLAGMANAVSVPFFLPQAADALARDMGTQLEAMYVPAVGRSFEAELPGQCFTNHHKAGLAGKLHVAPGSRHDRLLRAMQEGVTVGFVFLSLAEYSIPAALEQMRALPERCLLTGGVDLCAALVGSPELLLRPDGYSPVVWLAGLGAETSNAGYHFEAYGRDLTFNRRVHFNQAAECWTSALTVLE